MSISLFFMLMGVQSCFFRCHMCVYMSHNTFFKMCRKFHLRVIWWSFDRWSGNGSWQNHKHALWMSSQNTFSSKSWKQIIDENEEKSWNFYFRKQKYFRFWDCFQKFRDFEICFQIIENFQILRFCFHKFQDFSEFQNFRCFQFCLRFSDFRFCFQNFEILQIF